MSLRAFMPTDVWVRWLLVPAVAFIALAGNTNYLADYWHHLARGRYIVEHGRILDHDIFTYTIADRAFQDVNWLAQVSYYQLHQFGGLGLVRVVNALLVALTLTWLVALCRRVSSSLPVALGVGIAVFLGLWDVLTIRPQTFSLLLFVAMMDILERSQRRPWLLAIPPLLMAFWANLHGAFPAGLMLLGCWWLASVFSRSGEPSRTGTAARLVVPSVCLIASTLATLCNPYGWNIYRYVLQTSNIAAARGIDEWLPPGLDQLIGLAFYTSLPVVAALVVLAWKKRGTTLLSVQEIALIACFLPLACGSVRMVAWWLLAMAPMIACRIAVIWPGSKDTGAAEPNRGAIFSSVGLCLAALMSLPSLQRYNPLFFMRTADPTTAEVHEAQSLLVRDLEGDRVFSRFEWGEYLSWAAHPRLTVFMDGRIEIYPDDVWQAYAAVTCGQTGWSKILDDYQIDALLLDAAYHRRTGLLHQVERSHSWQLSHRVGNALVFTRAQQWAQ